MCAPFLLLCSGLSSRKSPIATWEAPQGSTEMAKAVWQRRSNPELQFQVGRGVSGAQAPSGRSHLPPGLGSPSLHLPPVTFALLSGSERGISCLRAWVQIQLHLAWQRWPGPGFPAPEPNLLASTRQHAFCSLRGRWDSVPVSQDCQGR